MFCPSPRATLSCLGMRACEWSRAPLRNTPRFINIFSLRGCYLLAFYFLCARIWGQAIRAARWYSHRLCAFNALSSAVPMPFVQLLLMRCDSSLGRIRNLAWPQLTPRFSSSLSLRLPFWSSPCIANWRSNLLSYGEGENEIVCLFLRWFSTLCGRVAGEMQRVDAAKFIIARKNCRGICPSPEQMEWLCRQNYSSTNAMWSFTPRRH